MKLVIPVVAALVALLPAVQAQPACANGANAGLLTPLAITNTVKRTTVNGGMKVVQVITVRNGAAAANGLALRSTPLAAQLTLLKGNTKPRATVTAAAGAVTTTAFNLAAGATLKATITYKSQRCPPATVTVPVPIQVFVPADGTPATCAVNGPAATVTITRKPSCK